MKKTCVVLALVALLAALSVFAIPAHARKGTNPVNCLTNPLACL